MDVTGLTSLLIVVVPIIGAVIVNIIVALKTNHQLADISSKTDIITGHVDGAATAATSKIDALVDQVTELKKQLAEDKEKAALLAQSATLRKREGDV